MIRRAGKRSGFAGAAAILTLTVAACAVPGGRRAPDDGTDPRLNLTTFYEEGRIAFLAVDTRAASMVRSREILPLAIIYVNKSGGAIRLNVESFTLRDPEGTVYPLISYETFREQYSNRVGADNRLSEPFYESTNVHLGIDSSTVSPYRFVAIPFYGADGPRANRLELGSKNYTRGFVYFPVPSGGLKDRIFELNVRSPDLPQDIFVRFRIP